MGQNDENTSGGAMNAQCVMITKNIIPWLLSQVWQQHLIVTYQTCQIAPTGARWNKNIGVMDIEQQRTTNMPNTFQMPETSGPRMGQKCTYKNVMKGRVTLVPRTTDQICKPKKRHKRPNIITYSEARVFTRRNDSRGGK